MDERARATKQFAWDNPLVGTASQSDLFRKLPSVDELLRLPELKALAVREGRVPVADAARSVLAQLRESIGSGKLAAAAIDPAVSKLPAAVE